jgi:cell wall-associated NlpC family hydrolase
MNKWYEKYIGIQHKHLGDTLEEGMDCFNLLKYILEQEKGYKISYSTYDKCNIADDDWYLKTSEQLIENTANSDPNWELVLTPKVFDIITISIGSTNITNHCAMYVDNNKIIHNMVDRPAWVSKYAPYYKQYTTGMYRWNPSQS